jgi:large subunit ribosomal protein L17
MRHRVKGKNLQRTKAHYKATIRNLASELIRHKEIKTTLVKAKELRPYIEKLISHSREDSVHKRRIVFNKLNNRDLVYELFHTIGPKNADRNGGYTRILKLGPRLGDGTDMAIIQLLGFEAFGDGTKKPARSSKKDQKPMLNLDEEKSVAASAEADETVVEETPETTPEMSEKEETTAAEEVAEEDTQAAGDEAKVAEDKAETETKDETPEAETKEDPVATEKTDDKKDDTEGEEKKA